MKILESKIETELNSAQNFYLKAFSQQNTSFSNWKHAI